MRKQPAGRTGKAARVWKKRGVLADIKTGLRAWVRVQYEYLVAELLLLRDRGEPFAQLEVKGRCAPMSILTKEKPRLGQ